MSAPSPVCHNCGAGPLRLTDGYNGLHRVSSDCRPQPEGGRLATCTTCGLVQAVTDMHWRNESDEIYRAYQIYHQGGGVEQSVFDPKTGHGRPRSEVLIEQLLHTAELPEKGRLLDIGCGNGSFLRACSQALPGWTLSGSEFDDRNRSSVENIPGVDRLYTGQLAEIPGLFDVISLIHVLEHIPAPTGFLRQVSAKLAPGGWLFIEVPDCRTNPFILLVADHSSHFSPSSLSTVVTGAGLDIVRVAPPWVPKEISLLARPSQRTTDAEMIERNCEFLIEMAGSVAAGAAHQPFGVFGTSIAGTWLDHQTGRNAAFFVDEDPVRVGKQFDGRPVLAVSDIPFALTVFVPLAPVHAATVAHRLRLARPDVHFAIPQPPARRSESSVAKGNATSVPAAALPPLFT